MSVISVSVDVVVTNAVPSVNDVGTSPLRVQTASVGVGSPLQQPPVVILPPAPVAKKRSKVRCNALTRAGKRCKRYGRCPFH